MSSWRYAAGTKVPAAKSRAEVAQIVGTFGGTMLTIGWTDPATEAVAFKINGVPVMLKVHHPPKTKATLDSVVQANAALHLKRVNSIEEAYSREVDRRWRCMVIQIKAIATMILDAGVDPVNAFIGQVALPGGITVAERIAPELGEMLESGRMPTLAIGAGS